MEARKTKNMMHKIKPKVDEMMESSPSVGTAKKSEPKKSYPHLRLEHDFFPETKKWEVGKEYTISLKLKMTGLSIAKYQNDAEFDIIEADMNSAEEEKE